MIRVALVEDDPRCREELQQYLERVSAESNERFHVTCFSDGSEIVNHYSADYDLILMDIEMPGMDGMTAAEQIRQKDSEVVIIFITNMPQYVMKGYTVDALDYVLKPVSYYAFSQRISRALARMARRTKKYLTVPLHGGMKKFEVSDLTYVEVQNHSLIYHTLKEKFECKGSLTDVALKLEAEGFFRISNCYLVNLEHINSVQGNDVQVGDDLIVVSRTRKKPLMDALNNYLNEVSK